MRQVEFPSKRETVLVPLLAVLLSISAAWHYYVHGMTVAFTDTVARLLLGRSITDAVNPGLQQNGGIWPPLPQFFMQPFIQIDVLYRTGLAGAIPQMVSYVLASVCMYRLAKLYSTSALAAVGAFLIISNPNILAMQSVPMAESMFVSFMVMSVYFLAKWERNRPSYGYLMLCGICVAGACYTRYEGYILALAMLPVVTLIVAEELRRYDRRSRIEGVVAHVFVFGISIAIGLGIWLLFQAAYFRDPIYFLRSPYSPWAVAQESLSYVDDQYKTGGKLMLSLKVYSRTVFDNVGIFPLAISAAGLFLCVLRLRVSVTRWLIPFIFLFPFPFFVFALYQGSSVVIWHPDYMFGANWATRYGTLMIPAVALFASFAISKVSARWLRFVAVGLIALTSVVMGYQGPISLGEAIANQEDEETQAQRAAGEWLSDTYDGGLVLMQRANSASIAFDSEIDLRDIVSENNPAEWDQALKDPVGSQIDWIVMRKAIRTGQEDSVWRSLHASDALLEYRIIYDENGVQIYRRM